VQKLDERHMNGFDVSVVQYINQYARQSVAFDAVANYFTSGALLRGAIVIAALWWLWFRKSGDQKNDRSVVVAAMAGAIFAVGLGRLLASALPMRIRPILDPALHLQLPYGPPVDALRFWNSFPSDHAMAFFCLTASLWFVSRRLSLALSLYVLAFVALPRLYVGLHYPTDLIGGALIGILVAWIANRERIRNWLAAPMLSLCEKYPGPFYAMFFLFSHELASLFNDTRNAATLLFRLLVK
jgi:undecaprenyl-diphosphatase